MKVQTAIMILNNEWFKAVRIKDKKLTEALTTALDCLEDKRQALVNAALFKKFKCGTKTGRFTSRRINHANTSKTR